MKWLQSVQSDRKPSRTFLYRTSGRSFLRNMAAVRSSSPELTTPCTSGICFSTTSSLRTLPDRANNLRRSRARCGMSSHNAGCGPKAPTTARTRSVIYYLSMEFLIGRSLANNITNLLLDPVREANRRAAELDWLDLIEAGTRRRPRQRRARAAGGLLSRFDGDDAVAGDGLRSALRIRHLQADHPGRLAAGTAGQLAARPDPWEVARPHETVEVKLNCSFEMRGGQLRAVPGRPSDA